MAAAKVYRKNLVCKYYANIPFCRVVPSLRLSRKSANCLFEVLAATASLAAPPCLHVLVATVNTAAVLLVTR